MSILLLLACTETYEPFEATASADGAPVELTREIPEVLAHFTIGIDPSTLDAEALSEALLDDPSLNEDMQLTFQLDATLSATDGIGSDTWFLFWSDDEGVVPQVVNYWAPPLDTDSTSIEAPQIPCDLSAGCSAGYTVGFQKMESGTVEVDWSITAVGMVGDRAAEFVQAITVTAEVDG